MTDEFAQAVEAQKIREQLTEYATGAVVNAAVDRDWANRWLTRLGAAPVTSTAEYKINAPVSGLLALTVKAQSRAEAVEKFNGYVQEMIDKGQVNSYYARVFQPAVQVEDLTFFSGPEDPPEPDDNAPALDLDGLRTQARQMLMDGVAEQGWGHYHAIQAAKQMGLEPLPKLNAHIVTVPVAGTADIVVEVFEGGDDAAVQRAADAYIARRGSLSVTPEEVGTVGVRRPAVEDMGLTVVDDDQDDAF